MELNGHKGERRKDDVGQQNLDVSTSISDDELDPWTAWAYKPQTITLLFIGSCFLIWASGALDPESNSSDDIVTSVKRGIWAMIAVFLTYCLLQAPSTMLNISSPTRIYVKYAPTNNTFYIVSEKDCNSLCSGQNNSFPSMQQP